MEKALKMNHFYSVLTIAFPEQPPTHIMEKGRIIPNPSTRGTQIQGLHVHGLQIKMNILHDDGKPGRTGARIEEDTNVSLVSILDKSHFVCQWKACTNNIHNDRLSLETHVLNDHSSSLDGSSVFTCQWSECAASLDSKDDWITHMHEHTSTLPSSVDISSSSSPPSCSPEPSSPRQDGSGSPTQDSNKNEESPSTVASETTTNGQSGELKGVALVAIHLLRSLSEDPGSPAFITPYEIKLINAADNKPSLSHYVYSILSNIRLHSPPCS